MKKQIYLLLICALLFFGFSIQKGKYITNSGKISFYSSTPIENIDANNNKVTSLLDTDNGSIVFSVNIKDFTFQKSLMQEHFNENYIESDKYPKSTFNGKITNLSDIKFDQNGKYNAMIEGNLTIHNVTKPVKVSGTIEVQEGKILANAKFQVKLVDYKIKVPSVVFQNIAEVIDVTVDMHYTPYNK